MDFESPGQVLDKDDSAMFTDEIDYVVPSTPAWNVIIRHFEFEPLVQGSILFQQGVVLLDHFRTAEVRTEDQGRFQQLFGLLDFFGSLGFIVGRRGLAVQRGGQIVRHFEIFRRFFYHALKHVAQLGPMGDGLFIMRWISFRPGLQYAALGHQQVQCPRIGGDELRNLFVSLFIIAGFGEQVDELGAHPHQRLFAPTWRKRDLFQPGSATRR